MTKNNHRTVNMFDQAGDKPVTIARVSISFAIVSLVAFSVLLAGTVNSSAITIFILLPVLAFLSGGRALSGPTLVTSVIALAGLGLMQLSGMLPPVSQSMVAFLGVLATILAGLVATLIALALMVSAPQSGTDESVAKPDNIAEFVPALPANGPVLMIETTPLGRVTSLSGRVSWVPGLEVGSVIDLALRDRDGEALEPGQHKLPSGADVRVKRLVTDHGEQWLLLEVGADVGHDAENNEIEAALKERTEFFASLGHDLKSPLNSVIGFAEMMDDELLGPMPAPYKDYPGLIRQGGRSLLRLIEDMLSYARSEAGTYEIEPAPIDIAASGEAVMRQSEGAAKLAGVTLQLQAKGEVMANADAGAVQRIWDNLISNAIKYSEEGGLVRLAAKQRGTMVQLSVIDHGAGMDADDLARIAKPFSQGRNAKGRAGTGLGLAMVHKLAEMHGGQVAIRTALGQGTQVTVTLPALVAQDQSRAAE